VGLLTQGNKYLENIGVGRRLDKHLGPSSEVIFFSRVSNPQPLGPYCLTWVGGRGYTGNLWSFTATHAHSNLLILAVKLVSKSTPLIYLSDFDGKNLVKLCVHYEESNLFPLAIRPKVQSHLHCIVSYVTYTYNENSFISTSEIK